MPYYAPDGSIHFAQIPKEWPPVGWTYNDSSGNWEPPDGKDHESVVDIISPDGSILRLPKELYVRRLS